MFVLTYLSTLNARWTPRGQRREKERLKKNTSIYLEHAIPILGEGGLVARGGEPF